MFKVLLVEDEDMIRRGIRFSIDWVQYDCIVIEEGLNGQDGYEKICELAGYRYNRHHHADHGWHLDDSGRPQARYLQRIIISGYNEFHLSALQLGVSEFLVKPLEDETGRGTRIGQS